MREILVKRQVLNKVEFMTKKYEKVENGGLLFGRMNPSWIRIYSASDAGKNALRSQSKVIFDHEYLLKYTEAMAKLNLFIIGTWHSHPSHSTTPSNVDTNTMRKFSSAFDDLYKPIFCITLWNGNGLAYDFYRIENGQVVKENGTINILEGGLV